MRIAVFDTTTGQILRTMEVPVGHASFNAGSGEDWLPCEAEADDTHYVDVGAFAFVQFPARPSPSHSWDWSVKAWVGDVSDATLKMKRLVEQERIHRNLLPVLYDGKRLDGDGTAQKNLSDKLNGVKERLRLGVPMDPAIMVWKDADNIVHQWTDLQIYCDWLAGYVIALEERGTRLYAMAWYHKANLDSMTDMDSVEAYDINQGWPE